MKFITSVFAAASLLATLVSAKNGFITPETGAKVKAGEPCLITWTADTPGPIDIILGKGDSKNLDSKGRIVLLMTNFGNYTWDVPADTPAGDDYAFMIKWGAEPGPDDINYTGLFSIVSDDEEDDSETTTTSTGTASATTTAETSVTETSSSYSNNTVTKTTLATTTTVSGSSNLTITSPNPTATEGADDEDEEPRNSTSTTTTAPGTTNSDSAASSFGASVGVAAIVAVAAALF